VNDINLMTWFADRRLDFCPKHFVKTNAELTEERLLWVYEKCKGRFCVENSSSKQFSLLFLSQTISFEDPQEAVLFELTWS
jgi:hypothetical protein